MTVAHIKLTKNKNTIKEDTFKTDNTTSTTTALCNDYNNINDMNDELLQTTFKWMFWSPHHLVKDDVFFAPPSTVVNQNWVPTPCLSPVTSPSDFLCDREPLFDGLDQDDIYTEQIEESTKDISTCSSIKHSSMMLNDDDWSTLFSGDEYDFLPLTPSSTAPGSNNNLGDASISSGSCSSSNSTVVSDDEDDINKQQWVMNGTAAVVSPITSKQSFKRRIEMDHPAGQHKRSKTSITLFQNLTKLGIDWCRYCGTTEGVNWRPGPWGKRTLCNKHGCDYKGYGLASRLPRLDLSAFTKEKLEDRKRPIVQQFCVICQLPEKSSKNKLVSCEGGCSRAYHQDCHTIKDVYCNSLCHENKQKNKVVVDLPRKYLPLMRSQLSKKSFLL
ncbi:unnamed protein product [Mucor hiemalis]